MFPVRVTYEREVLVLPDGGIIALDWADGREEPSKMPVVIISPALMDSSRAQNVQRLIKLLNKRGYKSVVYIPRGCGGLALKTKQMTNGYSTEELRMVISHVASLPFTQSVYAVGFSIGGSVLLKLMGEDGTNCLLKGAVAISPTFDYNAPHDPYEHKWWNKNLFIPMMMRFLNKHRQLLNVDETTIAQHMEQSGTRAFDQMVVAPIFGFSTVEELYYQSSPIRNTQCITVPTFTLSAIDDPIAETSAVPLQGSALLGPGLVSGVTRTGGHFGFMEGILTVHSWSDRATVDWLDSCM